MLLCVCVTYEYLIITYNLPSQKHKSMRIPLSTYIYTTTYNLLTKYYLRVILYYIVVTYLTRN